MEAPSLPVTPDCEIVTTRTVQAPRSLAFLAWTDPEHLSKWWGPAGFTNTFSHFDLTVGGRWNFIMHGPDKGHYHNECEFTRIEAPALLSWKRHSKPLFDVFVTFEEVTPGQTKITFRQIFDTPEACGKIRPYVLDKNEENFDRLEAELRHMSALRNMEA